MEECCLKEYKVEIMKVTSSPDKNGKIAQELLDRMAADYMTRFMDRDY